MGVIVRNRLRERADVWCWRVRHWWMDTESGAEWRIALLCVAVLVTILQLIRVSIAALSPPAPDEPAKAFYWWVVQLIIAIVSAIISYALRPKAQGVAPSEAERPTVDDGTPPLRIYGDVWVKAPFILDQQVVAQEPIKQGKK